MINRNAPLAPPSLHPVARSPAPRSASPSPLPRSAADRSPRRPAPGGRAAAPPAAPRRPPAARAAAASATCAAIVTARCSIGKLSGATVHIEVYNTYLLNDCPAAGWASVDAAAIKAEQMADVVILNGPRYWMMDVSRKAPSSTPRRTPSAPSTCASPGRSIWPSPRAAPRPTCRVRSSAPPAGSTRRTSPSSSWSIPRGASSTCSRTACRPTRRRPWTPWPIPAARSPSPGGLEVPDAHAHGRLPHRHRRRRQGHGGARRFPPTPTSSRNRRRASRAALALSGLPRGRGATRPGWCPPSGGRRTGRRSAQRSPGRRPPRRGESSASATRRPAGRAARRRGRRRRPPDARFPRAAPGLGRHAGGPARLRRPPPGRLHRQVAARQPAAIVGAALRLSYGWLHLPSPCDSTS